MQYRTFIENAYFIFKNRTTNADAFRLMVRADGEQNKLYIDRVMTATGFAGTEDADWEAIEVIQSPAELDKLGKFIIGGKDIGGTDYFIWAELLTTLGIMGEADTDYYLINIEN